MAPRTKGITVTGVEVREFRRIRFAEVKLVPGVGLIQVTGPNRSGKTSLLGSIRAALGGTTQIGPAPVNDQAEDGTAQITLTLSNGFTVRRSSTPANPKGYLTVVGPDGGKHAQGKLDEWLGPLSFDPLAFFGLDARRQREILLSVGRDPELAGKIDQLRARRAQRYEERTPWISQKRRAAQVRPPAGERPEPVDTSAEMQRLRELQAQDRDRGDARREIADARAAARAAEREATVAGEAVEAAADLVADLERRLANAREALNARRSAHRDALATIDAANQAVKVSVAALEALPDPSADMLAVQARLSEAGAVDRALEPWRAYDRAQEDLAEATAAEQSLTAQMQQLEQQERELIAGAGIPVDGLTFGDDGAPLLNGRLLAVASGAEKIAMAVAVALAADPDLRICLIDEANGIDLEGLEALDALAREHGFQIWAARLGLEAAGEIVVLDGKAWARDAAPATEEIAAGAGAA